MSFTEDCMVDKKGIIPPDGGWEERSWYLVEVSYFKGNPIHQSLFFTGFLQEGQPGGYNSVVPIHGTADHQHTQINDVRYLNALKLLHKNDDE